MNRGQRLSEVDERGMACVLARPIGGNDLPGPRHGSASIACGGWPRISNIPKPWAFFNPMPR